MTETIDLEGKVEPMELIIGDTELKVYPSEGKIDDDLKILATRIDVELTDKVHQHIEEGVEWDREKIKDVVSNAWIKGKEEWPDTSDKDWTDNRLLREDTKLYVTLRTIVTSQPTTTNLLEGRIGEHVEVSNTVYRLKKKNLVASIGREGQGSILVPTHLGMKEVYNVEGSEWTEYFDVEESFKELQSNGEKESSE